MGDLTDDQKEAALALLQAMLSDEGYEQVLESMAADDVLGEWAGDTTRRCPRCGLSGSDRRGRFRFALPD